MRLQMNKLSVVVSGLQMTTDFTVEAACGD